MSQITEEASRRFLHLKLEQLFSFDEAFKQPAFEYNVYYCSICKLVLASVFEQLDVQFLASTIGRCPDCGERLDHLEVNHDRFIGGPGAIPYFDSRLDPAFHCFGTNVYQETMNRLSAYSKSPVLQSSDSVVSLRSRLRALSGSRAGTRGHYECARAALKGKVVFLDGGNSFNASYLRESVGIEEEKLVLDNIMVSRAFNFHQMTSLVVEKLPEAIRSYNPRTVAIFEPTLLYEEDNVIDENEAWYSFKSMVWTLRRLSLSATETQLFLVVSNLYSRTGQMLQNITQRVDTETHTHPLVIGRSSQHAENSFPD